jgi:hypothetical protein
VGEVLTLMHDLEIGRKYGKTMTFNETKYDLEDFKAMLLDNPEFYDEVKQSIINKIKNETNESKDQEVESVGSDSQI